MNTTSEPEFDRFASVYNDVLKASLPPSQAEDPYFTAYKVQHMARRVAGWGGQPPERVLDFGCGIGKSLPLLRQHFPHTEVWGYDVSPDSLRLAHNVLPQARLTSQWASLPPGQFDLILAANVFHHIPVSEQEGALKDCAQLLTPGRGRLFIFEHNPLNPVTRRVFERCPFDQDATMLTRERTLALAAAAGMQVVHFGFTLFFPRQLAWLRPLERWMGALPLGAQYCAELAT